MKSYSYFNGPGVAQNLKAYDHDIHLLIYLHTALDKLCIDL